MALHKDDNSQGLFFGIKHGGFTLESDKPEEGFIETEVFNPRTQQKQIKYLNTYRAIEGRITKITWYDRDHAKGRFVGFKLTIYDQGEYYVIDFPFGKRHYNYFCRVMDNIDYEKPVVLRAYPKKDDKGRDYTEMSIMQDGKYIEQKYTKMNPGDCPQSVQNELGKWDSTDRHIWLRDRLFDVIIPHVTEINASGDYENDVDERPAQAAVAATPAFTGPVAGTPPEMEDQYREASKFDLDAAPDEIPF